MNHPVPHILSIVGRKGAGKTTLIETVIRTLTGRGYRVAGVRHSPHTHPVDKPGSDTGRFRAAGSAGAALLAADEATLFTAVAAWDEKITLLKKMFSDCHLIVMEGGSQNSREKIEIVPEGEGLVSPVDERLKAVVGSNGAPDGVPFFREGDTEALCSFIEECYLRPVLSAAVLAGGKSSRLGRNKALVRINGEPLIDRMVRQVNVFCSDVRIVSNSPSEYAYLGLDMSEDIRPGCGPLSGIHTALTRSATDFVLVTSCDMPLITADCLKNLVKVYPGYDITIYKHKNFEPLCAVYRRTCLSALDELIDHEEYRIIDLFPSLAVHVVRTDTPDMFKSINTEEDLRFIQQKFS